MNRASATTGLSLFFIMHGLYSSVIEPARTEPIEPKSARVKPIDRGLAIARKLKDASAIAQAAIASIQDA